MIFFPFACLIIPPLCPHLPFSSLFLEGLSSSFKPCRFAVVNAGLQPTACGNQARARLPRKYKMLLLDSWTCAVSVTLPPCLILLSLISFQAVSAWPVHKEALCCVSATLHICPDATDLSVLPLVPSRLVLAASPAPHPRLAPPAKCTVNSSDPES